MIKLRPYQQEAIDWLLSRDVNCLLVAPTGAGKSVIIARLVQLLYADKRVALMVHREELLLQLSETLSKFNIEHGILARKNKPSSSNVLLVSAQTLYSRKVDVSKIDCLILDEVQHYTQGGLFGTSVDMFGNARIIGFTATPLRLDGEGLGQCSSGYFSEMKVLTTVKELVSQGFLSPLKCYAPSITMDSNISGDVVEHYLKHSKGKKAITFCSNIGHAQLVAEMFNQAGIPSKAVSSKTPAKERKQAMVDFQNGKIINMVNVDLFSEGVDVTGLHTVIMLRKTTSYGLFVQSVGRAIRLGENKPYGIILDHVGNISYMLNKYNLDSIYDNPEWSLKDGEHKAKSKGVKDDLPKMFTCPKCAYTDARDEFIDLTCPDCGYKMQIGKIMKDFLVEEGDLVELDFNHVIDKLKERDKYLSAPRVPRNLPTYVQNSIVKKHNTRKEAIENFRKIFDKWSEEQYSIYKDSEVVRALFKRRFGICCYQLQTESATKINEIIERMTL